MMEVTPHLKSVLKNYQHSATRSLQGPGLSLVSPPKGEPPSPELKEEEEEYVPAPFPVQQLPILTTPDTSCSERTETVLEDETISCFLVGGEKRLCLPQVLKSVLVSFNLNQINLECEQLQIYCSRCTPEQLNVLKDQGILPSGAPSSGLITKTDAERLCSALLHGQTVATVRPRKGAVSFGVYHQCFGKCSGMCYPELFTSKTAKCIVCNDCQGGFSPQQFVCHVHKHYAENRTVHWGFDSANWRVYVRVARDQEDHEQHIKYLDEMKEQYDGKMPFPLPQNIYSGIKRKQVLPSEILKDRDLPLKKQKMVGEFLNGYQMPTPYPICLDSLFMHPCINDYNRHLSAFKPVSQHFKDTKIYHQLIGLNRIQLRNDPPILQDPKRVIYVSERERFESSFQPNVALAPHTPKKHRYGKQLIKEEPDVINVYFDDRGNIKQEIVDSPPEEKPPEGKPISVVQTASVVPKYNSEIELSTDTEDSASETSEKSPELGKIEEALKGVDLGTRDRVLDLFKGLVKEQERLGRECSCKDERIAELEARILELERVNKVEERKGEVLCNGDDSKRDDDTSSSIINSSESCDQKEGQTSVIASLEDAAEPKAIINTAPE